MRDAKTLTRYPAFQSPMPGWIQGLLVHGELEKRTHSRARRRQRRRAPHGAGPINQAASRMNQLRKSCSAASHRAVQFSRRSDEEPGGRQTARKRHAKSEPDLWCL
jgi:hypothetical protein